MADENNKVEIVNFIGTFVALCCLIAVVSAVLYFGGKQIDQDRLSYTYTNLHKAPICSVTKTNPDGSPSDFFCKRVSVAASADLWNKVKDYKPTKTDIQATTVQYDKNHITWSKDVIQEDYKN